ncbi:hypothetical protein pb186bvf_014865 [Paramecium bursaria]
MWLIDDQPLYTILKASNITCKPTLNNCIVVLNGISIEKKVGVFKNYIFIYDDEDVLFINTSYKQMMIKYEKEQKGYVHIYSQNQSVKIYGLENVQSIRSLAIQTNFQEHYQVIAKLGKGSFSKVYQCINRITDEHFAVKVISKPLVNFEQEKNCIKKEINLMKMLQHNNIINLCEIYESDQSILLVQGLMMGGTLENYIQKMGSLTEQVAMIIMRQILQGLVFIHDKGILHRDIKPSNILLRHPQSYKQVVICDFGLSDFYNKKGEYRYKLSGTPGYIAPEILNSNCYDFKIDVYSAGIVYFYMLHGQIPFSAQKQDHILMQNKRGNVELQKNIYSKQTRKLLKCMLEVYQNKRCNSYEALEMTNITESNALKQVKQTFSMIKNLNQICLNMNPISESFKENEISDDDLQVPQEVPGVAETHRYTNLGFLQI